LLSFIVFLSCWAPTNCLGKIAKIASFLFCLRLGTRQISQGNGCVCVGLMIIALSPSLFLVAALCHLNFSHFPLFSLAISHVLAAGKVRQTADFCVCLSVFSFFLFLVLLLDFPARLHPSSPSCKLLNLRRSFPWSALGFCRVSMLQRRNPCDVQGRGDRGVPWSLVPGDSHLQTSAAYTLLQRFGTNLPPPTPQAIYTRPLSFNGDT